LSLTPQQLEARADSDDAVLGSALSRFDLQRMRGGSPSARGRRWTPPWRGWPEAPWRTRGRHSGPRSV